MSEGEQKPRERESDRGPAEPLAGERLAAARREKQISVDEIAKELHIDDYKVRALERNDFEVLGAPVFAKGHLRKYAQLVGVRIEDVLADYYQLNRSVGMPPLVGRVREPSREINFGRWLWLLLIIIIAGAAYWWFVARETPQLPAAEPVSGQVSLPGSTDENDAANDAGDDFAASDNAESVDAIMPVEMDDTSDEVSGQASGQASPASDEDVETVPAVAFSAPGDLDVDVTYSGDCWTEITDSSGERLFFGLGRAGRTVSVSGSPPLSVLFGNADNVSLEVDGAAYPITAANRRGLTARFSIQAP